MEQGAVEEQGIRGAARRSSGLGWTRGNGLLCLGRQGLRADASCLGFGRPLDLATAVSCCVRFGWMDGLREMPAQDAGHEPTATSQWPLMPIAITSSYDDSLCSLVAQQAFMSARLFVGLS